MEEIKKQIETVEEHTEDVYQLAIKTLDRNYKRERFMIKCLLAIISALIVVLVWFGYIIYSTKNVTATQDGIYNNVKVDDKGNIITSELTQDEIQALIEALNEYNQN